MHTCIHTYIHAYIYTCIHIYIHTYTRTTTHEHARLCKYQHIYICIHTFTFVGGVHTCRQPSISAENARNFGNCFASSACLSAIFPKRQFTQLHTDTHKHTHMHKLIYRRQRHLVNCQCLLDFMPLSTLKICVT
jgi:hypothetical protein